MKSKKIPVFLFLFFFFLYALFSKAGYHTDDENSYSETAKSIATNFKVSMDKNKDYASKLGCNNNYYSRYGIGMPASSILFVWIGILLRNLTGIASVTNTTLIFFNISVVSLTMVVLYFIFIKLNLSKNQSFILVLITGLSTNLFYYAVTFFSEPLVTLLLLGIVFNVINLIRKEFSKSSLFSLCFFNIYINITRPNTVFFTSWLIIFLYFFGFKKYVKYIIISLFISCSFLILFNYYRFNDIFDFGYTNFDVAGNVKLGFYYPLLKGIVNNLFNIDRSIIIYSPVIIVCSITIKRFYKFNKKIFIFILGLILINIFTYAKWTAWEGGLAFGSRFMLPIIPLFIILSKDIFYYLKKMFLFPKFIIILLVIIGFIIQLIGLSIDYQAIGSYYFTLNKDYYVAGIRYKPFSSERLKINKRLSDLGTVNFIKFCYYLIYHPPKSIKKINQNSIIILDYWIHEPNYTPVFYFIKYNMNWNIFKFIYMTIIGLMLYFLYKTIATVRNGH